MKEKELYHNKTPNTELTIELVPAFGLFLGIRDYTRERQYLLLLICFAITYDVKHKKFREVPNV